jgi:hypothetical protein
LHITRGLDTAQHRVGMELSLMALCGWWRLDPFMVLYVFTCLFLGARACGDLKNMLPLVCPLPLVQDASPVIGL